MDNSSSFAVRNNLPLSARCPLDKSSRKLTERGLPTPSRRLYADHSPVRASLRFWHGNGREAAELQMMALGSGRPSPQNLASAADSRISVPASIPIVFCWACSKPTADLCARRKRECCPTTTIAARSACPGGPRSSRKRIGTLECCETARFPSAALFSPRRAATDGAVSDQGQRRSRS
jgi:hypothetical protein